MSDVFQPRIPVTLIFGAALEPLVKASVEGSLEIGIEDEARNLPAVRLRRFHVEEEVVIEVAQAETDVAVEPAASHSGPFQRIERRA